jgi:hypothetical protein
MIGIIVIPNLVPGKIYNLIDNSQWGCREVLFRNAFYVGITRQTFYSEDEYWWPHTFLVNKKLECFGRDDFECFDIEEVK